MSDKKSTPRVFAVSSVVWCWRIADKLMVPIMFVLRGFRFDSIQETHIWHVQDIDPIDVDVKLAVSSQGSDTTRFDDHHGIWFHVPILGGWKNYSVYEVDKSQVPFHIGWIMHYADSGKLIEAKLHRLPINDTRIRMLDGPPSYKGYFFAVDQGGKQISLKKVGQGKLGDGRYLSVRLF